MARLACGYLLQLRVEPHSLVVRARYWKYGRSPAAIRRAVGIFEARGPYRVVSPRPTETSIIFKWGVRLEYVENGKNVFAWACIADEDWRTSGRNLIKLYIYMVENYNGVQTPAAATQISSLKAESELATKPKRDADIEHLQ